MKQAPAHVPAQASNAHVPAISRLLSNRTAPGDRPEIFGHSEAAGYQGHRLFPAGPSGLTVASPNDPFERQAEEVAAEVMRMPEPRSPVPLADAAGGRGSGGAADIHRKPAAPVAAPPQRAAPLIAASSGSGLPASARAFFEPRFGRDLGHVRIHDGEEAASSARAINARAFTHGSDIYFARGEYNASSTAGRAVLAHEIAHSLQPRSSGSVHRLLPLGPILVPFTELLDERTLEFLRDALASIVEAPKHMLSVLGDVMDEILANWDSFVKVTALFLALQGAAIGFAMVPLGWTQVVAVILEGIIVGLAAYFAALQLLEVLKAVRRWWNLVADAHGDPKKITEASVAFCHVLLNIVLVIFAILGIRGAPSLRQRKIVKGTGSQAKTGSGSTGTGGSKPNTGGTVNKAGSGGSTPTSGSGVKKLSSGATNTKGGTGSKPVNQKKMEYSKGDTDVATKIKSNTKTKTDQKTKPNKIQEEKFLEGWHGEDTKLSIGPDGKLKVEKVEPNPDKLPPFERPRPIIVTEPLDKIKDEQDNDKIEVRLVLPAQKAVHADLYRDYVANRLLQHKNEGRVRKTAQTTKWDNALYAYWNVNKKGTIYPIGKVFDRGLTMSLEPKDIVRPSWTRDNQWMPTEVDHIVENQVTKIGFEFWFDNVTNYELLDGPSNIKSRDKFIANIKEERLRLTEVTGDPSWLSRDLTFTVVQAPAPTLAGRWSRNEIRDGIHLDVLEAMKPEKTPLKSKLPGKKKK